MLSRNLAFGYIVSRFSEAHDGELAIRCGVSRGRRMWDVGCSAKSSAAGSSKRMRGAGSRTLLAPLVTLPHTEVLPAPAMECANTHIKGLIHSLQQTIFSPWIIPGLSRRLCATRGRPSFGQRQTNWLPSGGQLLCCRVQASRALRRPRGKRRPRPICQSCHTHGLKKASHCGVCVAAAGITQKHATQLKSINTRCFAVQVKL